ncbi:DUF4167 domain-containing protein [Novosphingobium bradum]|uniref:DUF4167 domain-containing protein n=1 Tax=Novosphingobium bradum TaxID=1737444 RepID=A0ABV7ILR9_9SPHN
MNNNRGNNRRRGRGNNRPQGGGQQLNRIDSRARGNAPQLLEKYRKLAHDAHLNGDRVTEEYYLQFADHYFRVIADARTRLEEQRRPRDERWQEPGDEGEDTTEYSGGDYQGYDQGYGRPERAERTERAERPERADRPERGNREDRPREDRQREERPRDDRQREDRQRDTRREREPRGDEATEIVPAGEGAEGADDQPASIYEPVENPFVRADRPSRGLRPRREDRRPRRRDEDGEGEAGPVGLDVSILPPALGASREDGMATEPASADDEAPAPKKRGRKPKAVAAVSDED